MVNQLTSQPRRNLRIGQNLAVQDPVACNLVGQLLMEKYLVLEHLEVGGFSQTYLAVDTENPRFHYALKFLDRQLNPELDLPSLHGFFEAEAHALGRLALQRALALSPNPVPQLIAYCRDRHQVYLIQEFIEGERLDLWIEHRTTQPQIKDVIKILAEMLLILHYIHSQGIIHCDIKPSNIIQREGKLVLIDFGACSVPGLQLARCQDFALGTPGYMPQEQASGRPQLNSDLYALGMMMIEIITGIAPKKLERDPDNQLLDWHRYVYPIFLKIPSLIMILDHMVMYEPGDRYLTVLETVNDLQRLIPKLIRPSPSIFKFQFPRRLGPTSNGLSHQEPTQPKARRSNLEGSLEGSVASTRPVHIELARTRARD
jgi:serine/threonine protein kinase